MSAIKRLFGELKGRKEGALISYIMGGDPSLDDTIDIIGGLVSGGVDLIEVGIPFSEPIADGKTIQAAGRRALLSGVNWKGVLSAVSQAKRMYRVPIVIMTYFNILYNAGIDQFLDSAKESGVDGLILPDLPIEEASDVIKKCKTRSIDVIMMIAPSTGKDRLVSILKSSSGFIYLVSHYGVTGAKGSLDPHIGDLIRSAQSTINGALPLVVGFGISTPEQLKSIIQAGADGVVVGSALIDLISANKGKRERLNVITEYISRLKMASKNAK